jgi:hypothetical protein
MIPFFAFRIIVGCGLAMLALAWVGPGSWPGEMISMP